jgi:ribosome-associated translation inhibitor RaiA
MTTMTYPIQVTFQQMDRSDALETSLRDRAEKLAHFHPAINSCHVMVAPEGRHQHSGRRYNVRLDIKIKGKQIAVTRHADEDAFVAGREAFDAARRALEVELDLVRGFAKQTAA